jgi:translation initiation factor IF-2
MILERARALRGTRYDNISVVPDMTKMQRQAEDKLAREADSRNNRLTTEDRDRNLKWLVVGKRGEKRLIKGTERESQNNVRRNTQLGDYLPNNSGRGGPAVAAPNGRNNGGSNIPFSNSNSGYQAGYINTRGGQTGYSNNHSNSTIGRNEYELGARRKTYPSPPNRSNLGPTLLPPQNMGANYTPIQHRNNFSGQYNSNNGFNGPPYGNQRRNSPPHSRQQQYGNQYGNNNNQQHNMNQHQLQQQYEQQYIGPQNNTNAQQLQQQQYNSQRSSNWEERQFNNNGPNWVENGNSSGNGNGNGQENQQQCETDRLSITATDNITGLMEGPRPRLGSKRLRDGTTDTLDAGPPKTRSRQ